MRELEWLKTHDFQASKGHPVHSFQRMTTEASVALRGTRLTDEEYEWLLADIEELKKELWTRVEGVYK